MFRCKCYRNRRVRAIAAACNLKLETCNLKLGLVLLIGIDEAGYGPKLGPLCHGYSVFRCAANGGRAAHDLWAALHPAVMRHPAAAGSITVDDSKKVYSSGLGLGLLIEGVSAFLENTSSVAGTDTGKSFRLSGDWLSVPAVHDALYQRLLPAADRARLEEDPWGRAEKSVPREAHRNARAYPCSPPRGTDEFAPNSRREPIRRTNSVPDARGTLLGEALREKEVSVLALGARALSAKHFNAALGCGANKAEVSWSIIAAELQRLLALCSDGEDTEVIVDRQGGRKFYAAQLGALFPGAVPWVESEDPEASSYRIEAAGRTVRVAFLVNAESRSLPVALASMAAKLARELCMVRLNAFFKGHVPGLEPTAGYALDARRFLKETKAMRKELGIEDSAFVRMK